ncbi:MAG TPA: YciI family protein [Actinomycetota bacterium]
MPRFAYTYLMKDEPERVRAAAPGHAAYWHDLGPPGYLGGPFGDRSGGLITFEAEDERAARRLVDEDPFVRQDLLEASWLKEWAPEPP